MKTKSLNLDILVSPEIGLAILILDIIIIFYGYRQSKKEFNIDNFPFINPITKIIFGSFCFVWYSSSFTNHWNVE